MQVGVSNIGIYIPPLTISLDDIIARRGNDLPDLKRRLSRAAAYTEQRSIHFPFPWQDSVTLAAQAARHTMTPKQMRNLRFLVSATETSVDMSKPNAAYVQGLLNTSGFTVPNTLSTFQVQHACAGGTLGVLSVGSLLQNHDSGDAGLVLCSDIARYEESTSAELTQGAGAVGIFLEQNPSLLELDLFRVGMYSSDEDDFFRPLSSLTPSVQGRHSIDCYTVAIESSFRDYCRRVAQPPEKVLSEVDFFVLHVPFVKMAYVGMHNLFNKFLGMGNGDIIEYLTERGFFRAVEPVSRVGNIYTGSLYLCLRYLLQDRYQVLGDELVGKQVLMFSYGSGNTMITMSGTIAPEAGKIVQTWDPDIHELQSDFSQYERWLQQIDAVPAPSEVSPGHYYLQGIREDGYRQYGFSSG